MAAGHGGDAVQDYLAEDEIDNLNPALPELLRAWKCEKAAPELLNYEADLVQLVSETLFSQARALEGGSSAHHSVTALFHMDVARTRFLLTSYLRTRLAKIQRWAFHLENSEEMTERLSADEAAYLGEYLQIKNQHLNASVMSGMPREFRDMSEAPEALEGPRLGVHVFSKVVKEIGTIADPHGGPPIELTDGAGIGLLYDIVRPYVADKRVDLL